MGISHWTNQAEIHTWNFDQTSEKQSQVWTVFTVNLEKCDLNQFLSINTKGVISRLLHPVPHGGSGMNTVGAHNLFFFNIFVTRSFTADGNLLQPTGRVNRTPSHVTFSRSCPHSCQWRTWHWLKMVVRSMSSMFHACVCLISLRLSTLHSSQSLSSSTSFSWSSSSSSTFVGSMRSPMRTSANEELGTFADNTPLTGYEPEILDDYHISETTEIFIQESSSDSRPSNLRDLEISDYTIGRALSSPLFTQERDYRASRRQACHSPEKSSLPSQSLSVGHVRTGRPVSDEYGSPISNAREHPCRDSENEQIRILLERQKEQTLADYRAEIQKHEFQADYDRRNIDKLNEVVQSQRGEIYCAVAGDEQHRRDQQLLPCTIIGTNSTTSWSSCEKSQWDGRMEAISRLNIRDNFKEKIDRRSRHYPWTHRQDSGSSEWN